MKTHSWSDTGRGAALLLVCALSAFARVVVAQPTSAPEFATCSIQLGVGLKAITADDFNGDRIPDLAVADPLENKVVVLFTDPVLFSQGRCAEVAMARTPGETVVQPGLVAIAAGLLGDDTASDLVVAVANGVQVLQGNGNGKFIAQAPLDANEDPRAVVIADVDGDGSQDIVVGNGTGRRVTILYGKPSGFESPSSLPQEGLAGFPSADFVVVHELSGDGLLDIVSGSNQTGQLSVFIQGPARTFRLLSQFKVSDSPKDLGPTAAIAADFDRDGFADLALTSGGLNSGTLTVLRNTLGDPTNPSGPFVVSDSRSTGRAPVALAVDVVGESDFAQYAAVANQADRSVPFFLSDRHGHLIPPSSNCRDQSGPCSVGSPPNGIVLADLDQDGVNDVVTANTDGSISVLLSSLPPLTPTPTPQPSQTPTETPTVTSTPTLTPTPADTPTDTPTPLPTPTFASPCCDLRPGADCDQQECKTCVCNADAPDTFCCNPGSWDAGCVQLAKSAACESACSCPAPTSTPTSTPTPSPTQSSSPTRTPTETPTVTPTITGTLPPTLRPTRTPTPTPTITGTQPPTNTPTCTPTATPTATGVPSLTSTPTITSTPTPACFAGGVCLQGQGCEMRSGAGSSGGWLLALVFWTIARRRRQRGS